MVNRKIQFDILGCGLVDQLLDNRRTMLIKEALANLRTF